MRQALGHDDEANPNSTLEDSRILMLDEAHASSTDIELIISRVVPSSKTHDGQAMGVWRGPILGFAKITHHPASSVLIRVFLALLVAWGSSKNSEGNWQQMEWTLFFLLSPDASSKFQSPSSTSDL